MQTWNISDDGSLQEMTLGTLRSTVRSRFGEYREFRRTPSAPESDQFSKAGVMTTYDENQCLVLMELTWPSTVMFKGFSLLDQRLDNLVRLLGDVGIVIRTTPDPDVAYVEGIPLTLYVPNGVVEGVGLGIDE